MYVCLRSLKDDTPFARCITVRSYGLLQATSGGKAVQGGRKGAFILVHNKGGSA